MRKRKIALLLFITLLLILILLAYLLLKLSLPQLNGTITTPEIQHKVQLDRDKLGTAIITADSRTDAAFALGFAHGQDRFFQMDLLRRNAAGELAELFGEAAVEVDQKHRFHQFRKHAQKIFTHLEPEKKAILNAYTQGVNSALIKQQTPTFEYLLLGLNPARWLPEDSLLAAFSMYLDLQSPNVYRELALITIKQHLGRDMVNFINQNSPINAALDGSKLPQESSPIPVLPPLLHLINHRTQIANQPLFGSNNWAVLGQLTFSGKAMLSNDMHLGLNVPTIWYRTQLNYLDNEGENIRITGISLPGSPLIVVGSNGNIAWGFTNAFIDVADWIKIDKTTKISTIKETIKVNNAKKSKIQQLELSEFGPVLEINQQKLALSWVAHQNYAVNLNLLHLEQAKTVTQALDVSQNAGIPVQNMVLVDSLGSAAWRVTGAIPKRDNPSQYLVHQDNYEQSKWLNFATNLPVVINPNNQRLWTANNRVMGIDDYQTFGNGGYAIGSRAKQIKDNLFSANKFDEQNFFQMQLDNRALFLKPWHTFLLQQLEAHNQKNEFSEDIAYLKTWQACACSNSVGYTLTYMFRNTLIDILFNPLEQLLTANDLSLKYNKSALEQAIWQLIHQQPQSWLPPKLLDWNELFIESYRYSKASLLNRYSWSNNLQDLEWGKVNAQQIKHPFSHQMPFLGWLLDMPQIPGYGGFFEPAVQSQAAGASQRLVVQPGNEDDGIMSIPGGQSGHPLSPFYRAGFDDYAQHKATPLLPSEPIYSLIFKPANF